MGLRNRKLDKSKARHFKFVYETDPTMLAVVAVLGSRSFVIGTSPDSLEFPLVELVVVSPFGFSNLNVLLSPSNV